MAPFQSLHPREDRPMTMRFAAGACALLCLVPFATAPDAAQTGTSRYQRVENWLRAPAGQTLGTLSSVDVDARGFVPVFRRCPEICDHPKPGEAPSSIWTFDPAG